MSTLDDHDQIIVVSTKEQRQRYKNISNIYDQLRLKALALIAGEVAIVTFLFTNWDFWKLVTGGDRVFFLFTGIILLVAAFALLLWIVSTVQWTLPHDGRSAKEWRDDQNYSTYQSFWTICMTTTFLQSVVVRKLLPPSAESLIGLYFY